VNPVPDPLLLRKSGSARNQTQTSGYVVCFLITLRKITTYILITSSHLRNDEDGFGNTCGESLNRK
jgi:hypothetical protein